MLYFCLGYPLTGQYVVAIYKMLVTDVARFTILYGVFLMGFASCTLSGCLCVRGRVVVWLWCLT